MIDEVPLHLCKCIDLTIPRSLEDWRNLELIPVPHGRITNYICPVCERSAALMVDGGIIDFGVGADIAELNATDPGFFELFETVAKEDG